MPTTIDDQSIEALRVNFRGDLIRPGEPPYDEARAIYNAMIDRRPALIARCTGTADVVAAVKFARERDLLVAVRGGAHSVAGFSTCDDGVVIDLGRMRGVRVDPEARTARAQGGCTWGDYDHETQLFGLASPGGVVSTTGLAGLTLGGGFGLLSMKYGLACDNLVGADVVTADGEVIRASERENPDLFWGLRGGGGNFGIVTSFEFRLHPLTEIVLGLFLFPTEDAYDLLGFYRGFMEEAPGALASFASFLTVPEQPPMPIFPPEVLGKRMVAVLGAWPGSAEEGEKAFAAARGFRKPAFELVMPLPYSMAQRIQDADAPFGRRNYWKSAYLADFPDEVIKIVAERGAQAPSTHSQLSVGRFGGAIAEIGDDDTAFPLRDAGWLVQTDSMWDHARDDEANIAFTRELHEALAPHTLDRVYVNFIGDEGPERVRAAYGAQRYARLATLKQQYDPTNFFRLNQNIPPEG